LNHFPAHGVPTWLGYDVKVLLKDYAQGTSEHFERATSGANSGSLETEKYSKSIVWSAPEQQRKDHDQLVISADYSETCNHPAQPANSRLKN